MHMWEVKLSLPGFNINHPDNVVSLCAGSCILQYWNYSAASKPCKCPMCATGITKLTPEASLHSLQEQETTKVLGNVHRYNRLFVGGARGLVQVGPIVDLHGDM